MKLKTFQQRYIWTGIVGKKVTLTNQVLSFLIGNPPTSPTPRKMQIKGMREASLPYQSENIEYCFAFYVISGIFASPFPLKH